MRQVRDNLWIGDCIDARRHGDDFDTVISMVDNDRYDSGEADYRFPIPDGDHDFETYKSAVLRLMKEYESGKDVLIHCQAGVSRSTSVATAMLAVQEGKTWEDVLYDTRAGHAPVAPELMKAGKRYIEICERHDA